MLGGARCARRDRTPAGRRGRCSALALGLAGCAGCRASTIPSARRRAGGAGGADGAEPAAGFARRHHLRHLPGGGGARRRHAWRRVAGRVGTSPGGAGAAQRAARRTTCCAPGEVLLLPDGVPRPPDGGFGAGEVTHPAARLEPRARRAAIDGAPAPPDNPFQDGQTEPLIDPVRHRVEAGETAYSIARLYGVSVTALASWNGLGPDLAVRENQELLIPIVSDANRISGAADTQPGQGTPVDRRRRAPRRRCPRTSPPRSIRTRRTSASTAPRRAAGWPRRSSAAVTPAATTRRNPNGVGYAVPAGTPVRGGGGGEVALISEELGGLGTIVLIRHQDDLMTTYSTLVRRRASTKGDTVQAGEVIGTVAPRDQPGAAVRRLPRHHQRRPDPLHRRLSCRRCRVAQSPGAFRRRSRCTRPSRSRRTPAGCRCPRTAEAGS